MLLPRLASDHSPPTYHLPSSWDYRNALLCLAPTSTFPKNILLENTILHS
jgi:hypothetical protein